MSKVDYLSARMPTLFYEQQTSRAASASVNSELKIIRQDYDQRLAACESMNSRLAKKLEEMDLRDSRRLETISGLERHVGQLRLNLSAPSLLPAEDKILSRV
jgi:hypothetical protein